MKEMASLALYQNKKFREKTYEPVIETNMPPDLRNQRYTVESLAAVRRNEWPFERIWMKTPSQRSK